MTTTATRGGFRSVNPATGEETGSVESLDPASIPEILERGARAQRAWARTSFPERAERMRAAARLLGNGKERWARIMTGEMGKPIREARSEIEKCAWACEHFAKHAATFLADRPIDSDLAKSYVTFRPLGLVLAVMPWNFPFWQVFRFAAPGLMAGNGALLKHAPNVPGCARALEEIFAEAGFPEGLFQNLYLELEHLPRLLDDPRVAAATLTGSVRAGRSLAAAAGERILKTVLELGGSDPYVVLEDADVAHAAETCAKSRLVNSGQSCIAAKRCIVVRPLLEHFTERFVERMREARLGDPTEEETEVGPLAREDLRDTLHRQVVESVERGAELLLGGEPSDRRGWYYPPTVLAGVRPGMPAFDEELFGPVGVVVEAADEEEAIELANATSYGLGAAVFTRDVRRGERIAAERLEAGCCFVNDFVRSDPRLPFGGVKQSGYGRELGEVGIREFVNVKTVAVG